MNRFCQFLCSLSLCWVAAAGASIVHAQDQLREWTDVTGRFKMMGELIEVRGADVYLRKENGKTFRILVARLSQSDQEYLDGLENPFHEIPVAPIEKVDAPEASRSLWESEKSIDWDRVDALTPLMNAAWSVPQRGEVVEADFKPSLLPPKSNFHETVHPIVLNASCGSALVGYSVTFAVPKPTSRLVLVDLIAGKSGRSVEMNASMRPLALMDDGSTILMVGNGDRGYEPKDELQLWQMTGKDVVRSETWIPFPDENTDYGRVTNSAVVQAECLGDSRVLLLSENGHAVVLNVLTREPIWHARLSSRNRAIALSPDRKLIAICDEKNVMVVSADTGKLVGSTSVSIESVSFPKICWSVDGSKLAFSAYNELRTLDVDSGKWEQQISFASTSATSRGLMFPDEDFVMLNGRTLVHLPTRIELCEYTGISSMGAIGGTTIVCVQSSSGGIVLPTRFPHARAEFVLENAREDQSLFVVRPDTEVTIDVQGIPEESQEQVRSTIEKAATASGYRVVEEADVCIVASISGPTRETVRFITQGEYNVQEYRSLVSLEWQENTLWTKRSTNIPTVVFPNRGQSMAQRLKELGKRPDLKLFQTVRFPKFVQKPSSRSKSSTGSRSSAILLSTFTRQGIVDSE